jgi:hypothetical protein
VTSLLAQAENPANAVMSTPTVSNNRNNPPPNAAINVGLRLRLILLPPPSHLSCSHVNLIKNYICYNCLTGQCHYPWSD